MLKILAFITAMMSSAYAQAPAITELPPLTGTAIGPGYDTTNGTLFIPTSASLQSIGFPHSISFDAVTPAAPSVNGAFLTNGASSPATGFGFEYVVSFASDFYHIQHFLRPSYENGGDKCDQTGTGAMCWRQQIDTVRHHYCTSWQSNHGYLYMDGVLRDETTNVGTFTAATNTWQLGTSWPAGTLIYDMRVYNRALSADECVYINRLQQTPLNLIPNSGSVQNGLILHLALNDCTITGALYVCPDTSGNSNNATNDKAPPTVTILTPSPGTVSGNVSVTATCVDPAGLTCASVCYLLDGTAWSLTCPTTAPYTYSMPTANAVDGSHTLTAIGTNATGVQGVSSGVALTTSNSTSATTYYFNGSTGSDSNTCLSLGQACQTLVKLKTFVIKGGDTVNFAGTFAVTVPFVLCAGDSGCATQNFFPSSLTTTFQGPSLCNPFSLTTTNCAVFNLKSGQTNLVEGINPANLIWQNTASFGGGAALSAYCLTNGNAKDGIGYHFHAPLIGPNVSFINNWVQDFSCPVGMNMIGNGGPMLNFVMEDNVTNGSTNTAAVTQGIRWGAGSQGLVQGNLNFNDGGQSASNGNGIVAFNFPAPNTTLTTVQFNVVHDFGANNTACGGPIGFYSAANSYTVFQFNEGYRGLPKNYPVFTGCDWSPFDIDFGSQHVTMQYNYGHDSPVAPGLEWFVETSAQSWNNNVGRYNVFENNGGGLGIGGNQYDNTSYFYNNTISTAATGVGACWGGTAVGTTLANNLCIYTGTQTSGQGYVNTIAASPGTVLLNNDYFSTQPGVAPFFRYGPLNAGVNYTTLAAYQTASGQDSGSLNVNPMINGTPGTGGTCWNGGTIAPAGPQPCPSTSIYGLQHGSPLIGAAVDLTQAPYNQSVGTRDYWGNTIPNGVGSGYNIGAYGAAP